MKVEKCSLETNTRVHLHNDVDSDHIAEMLLKIGGERLNADMLKVIFYLPDNFVILYKMILLIFIPTYNKI